VFIARVTVNPRETAATPHPPAPRGRGGRVIALRTADVVLLLCMCDFSSVKKEILRILALNSECENTSSVLVGPFCASTGMWEPGATALKLLPESTVSLLAVVAVEVFSCLLEVLSGARRKQGEISNAPCISRRIAHLI